MYIQCCWTVNSANKPNRCINHIFTTKCGKICRMRHDVYLFIITSAPHWTHQQMIQIERIDEKEDESKLVITIFRFEIESVSARGCLPNTTLTPQIHHVYTRGACKCNFYSKLVPVPPFLLPPSSFSSVLCRHRLIDDIRTFFLFFRIFVRLSQLLFSNSNNHHRSIGLHYLISRLFFIGKRNAAATDDDDTHLFYLFSPNVLTLRKRRKKIFTQRIIPLFVWTWKKNTKENKLNSNYSISFSSHLIFANNEPRQETISIEEADIVNNKILLRFCFWFRGLHKRKAKNIYLST